MLWRRWRGWIAGIAVVAMVLGGALVWPRAGERVAPTVEVTFTAPGGVGEDPTITLDATIYLPDRTPAPAVILAHGLGGTKQSVTADANDLAADGYVVLAYTARGFGRSGGHVHLDSLDYEVPDARAAVDFLATRTDVVQDGPNDPRVGVMGGSYGGALSLMLAGTDPRVDAAVPLITWHNLNDALFPNYAVADGSDPLSGVFKRYWASILMTSITVGGRGNGDTGLAGLAGVLSGANGAATSSSGGAVPSNPAGPTTSADGTVPSGAGSNGSNSGRTALLSSDTVLCGRLAVDLCRGYLEVAQTGVLTPTVKALLDRSSPSQVAGSIKAPTLLVQGERDTIFGLDQADRNARAIAAAGTPVSVIWFAGGHDGGGIDQLTRSAIHSWFAHYLRKEGTEPNLGFRYSVDGSISDTGNARSRILRADGYPGISATGSSTSLTLAGSLQPVVNPPGGTPAAISSLPGVSGTAATALATLGLDVPGQSATFETAPLSEQVLLTGAATTSITVTAGPAPSAGPNASPPTGATFFVKLYKVSASGVRTLAGGSAAPIHITGLAPGRTVTVPIRTAMVALQVDTGSTIQLVVSSTDQAFAVPDTAAVHVIGLSDGGTLQLPISGGSNISTSEIPVGLLIALIALVVATTIGMVVLGFVRRRDSGFDPELADVPLRISKLRKQYAGGVVAVSDVSFDVLPGQVVGLLGPNGAGKTTTLRMVMGLIFPTAGDIRVFGHLVKPGAPVLSRIGSFVEGSGFLPHLSGRDNLALYWAANGRPKDDAHLEEALAIAGLGSAIDRRVRTYSQGMRQRLAIAQSMLGLPELLILDEPTNGLDPPQIHAMREVLRRYSETGRTVLISSHLLAEVEQTCTHAVVVHKGEVIASGTVAELVANSGEMAFTVDDAKRAAALLRELPGVHDVEVIGSQVYADLAGNTASVAVAALVTAGIAVTSAAPRNRLEDVFLDLVGATGVGTGKS